MRCNDYETSQMAIFKRQILIYFSFEIFLFQKSDFLAYLVYKSKIKNKNFKMDNGLNNKPVMLQTFF